MKNSQFDWEEYWNSFEKNDDGMPVITEMASSQAVEITPDLRRILDDLKSDLETACLPVAK